MKVTGEFRIGDIRHNYADLTKAKNVLNFSPKIDFESGIQNFVAWVNGQDVQNDTYEESIQEMKKRGLFK